MTRQSILVVDDELINVKLIDACLSREGFAVQGVLNAEEALKAIEVAVPDLILLDIMMPGIDGYTLCGRLKEMKSTRPVPIIMITALDDTKSRMRALEVGADDFLTKPIDLFELVVRVKSLLRIKSYHDELTQSLHAIEESNRKLMELEQAKESLMHMIVHDLRSPVTGMFGKLQVLQLKPGLAPTHRTDIDECLSCCVALNDMIDGILSVHRMEKGGLTLDLGEAVDPVETVRGVLAQFEKRADRQGVELNLAASAELPKVRFDPDLIQRVLVNLVDNALRVTPEGGIIQVLVNEPPEGSGVQFHIMDSGPGLPDKYHSIIFDKFQQVNLKRQGIFSGNSGLGLAFCKMVADAHGGKIWVQNRPSREGCHFTLEIPSAKQATTQPS